MNVKSIFLLLLAGAVLAATPDQEKFLKEISTGLDKTRLESLKIELPNACEGRKRFYIEKEGNDGKLIGKCDDLVVDGEVCGANPCVVVYAQGDQKYLRAVGKTVNKDILVYLDRTNPNAPTLSMAAEIPRYALCTKSTCIDGVKNSQEFWSVLKMKEYHEAVRTVKDNKIVVAVSVKPIKAAPSSGPCAEAFCLCANVQGSKKPIQNVQVGNEGYAVLRGNWCSEDGTNSPPAGYGQVVTKDKTVCAANLFHDPDHEGSPHSTQKVVECPANKVCGANLLGAECLDLTFFEANSKEFTGTEVAKDEGQMYAFFEGSAEEQNTAFTDVRMNQKIATVFCFKGQSLKALPGKYVCVDKKDSASEISPWETCLNIQDGCTCKAPDSLVPTLSVHRGHRCYYKGANELAEVEDFEYISCHFPGACKCTKNENPNVEKGWAAFKSSHEFKTGSLEYCRAGAPTYVDANTAKNRLMNFKERLQTALQSPSLHGRISARRQRSLSDSSEELSLNNEQILI